ncbi:hypothetical protein [Albibacillus kandeliae]|uniref:hypothetical protein n=1 Tax=Albibacillus kandeliae TaxID=2174228 RepID=UPI001300AB8F|nr:hypothetical protein [Albibacillus kandeliae]
MSEPNSYRLTDEAFKLLQALQHPVLYYKLNRPEELVRDFSRFFSKWFPLWIGSETTKIEIALWHKNVVSSAAFSDSDCANVCTKIWKASHEAFIESKEGKAWVPL